jgi:hypothetical protein
VPPWRGGRLAYSLVAFILVATTQALGACIDDDTGMAALAGAAGMQGVNSFSVVALYCKSATVGSYIRPLCPATCGLCPPPDRCSGKPVLRLWNRASIFFA